MPNRNQADATLRQIMTTTNTTYRAVSKENQLGDQSADLLEKSLGGIRNAIAKEFHDSVGDIAKNQNMGAVGSRREMWYDSRNSGSGVKTN